MSAWTKETWEWRGKYNDNFTGEFDVLVAASAEYNKAGYLDEDNIILGSSADGGEDSYVIVSDGDAERIVACVNALAGIKNPAAVGDCLAALADGNIKSTSATWNGWREVALGALNHE